MGNAWEGAYADDAMNFLTPMGIAQAEIAGWKLQYTGLKFTNMISSNMTRARQTMAITAHITGDWQRSFLIDPNLNERDATPGYSNDRQLQEEHRHTVAVTEAFYRIISLSQEGNLLVVSHHYTMEVLANILNIKVPLTTEGETYFPNAIPFIFDTLDGSLIVLGDNTKTPILSV